MGRQTANFSGKARESFPLIVPKCQGEMRIISFIDQGDVIKKVLQHLGLWEWSPAPPERDPAIREITFEPSYSQLTYLKVSYLPVRTWRQAVIGGRCPALPADQDQVDTILPIEYPQPKPTIGRV